MTAVYGAAFPCLQCVLLDVDDEQERAFMYETVDIGGCPLQSCQTLGMSVQQTLLTDSIYNYINVLL